MNKYVLITIFIVIVVSVLTLSRGGSLPIHQSEVNKFEKLIIKTKTGMDYTFKVYIADTSEKQEKGLMFVKHLIADKGMLFEMGREAITKFWMKNTLIPLDIIFISSSGEIKKIHENAEPLSLSVISSDVAVKAVLEINGGLSKKIGISKGDMILHPYFKTQPKRTIKIIL